MKKQYLSAFALALFASTAFAQTNPVRTVAEVAVPTENTTGKDVFIVLGNNLAARINTDGGQITGRAAGSPVRIVTVNATNHVYKIYDVKSGKWFANKGGATAPKADDQVTLSDTPSEWYIYNNNNGGDATLLDIAPKVDGAAITDGTIASWNFYQGYAAGKHVGYWDANDGNSAWRLYDPKALVKSSVAALAAANPSAATDANNAIDAASDEAGYAAALKAFRKALNGKKVRFFNTARNAKNYLTLSSPSCVATGDATEAPGAEDVFVLNYDEANDNYSLQHAVTGRRVNNVPGLNAGVTSTNENNARYDLYATGTNNTLSICNVTKSEDKNYLHLSKDTYTDGKLNVVRWESGTNSKASVWTLESASATTDAEILAAAKTRFDSYNIGFALGEFYPTEEELMKIVIQYGETSSLTLAEFQKLFSAYADKKFALNLPEPGRFFRIKSNNGTRYVTATGATTGEYQLITTDNGKDNGTIFFYDGDNRIVSYTTGRAIYRTDGSKSKLAPSSETNLATVEFGALADGKYKMLVKKDGNAATVYLHQDGKTDVDGLGGDNTKLIQTHLQLEDVTKFPVHFNDKGLATFFAPVSMEVPEGVEIYIATNYDAAKQRIHLDTFEGRVIPSGTAVLLRKGESASDIELEYYYLEQEKPVAAPTNNLFKGAATPSQIPAGQEARALKGDEFRVLGTTYVRGFRAYLSSAAGGATRSQLAFPGVTGVDQVTTTDNNADAPVFDLSGRRVEKPVAGQIYVQNGKKFLQR
jgi:hypothetical protein